MSTNMWQSANLLQVFFRLQPVDHVLSHVDTGGGSHSQPRGYVWRKQRVHAMTRTSNSDDLQRTTDSATATAATGRNALSSSHLTSKGRHPARDHRPVPFTTESRGRGHGATCCKHPVDMGRPGSSVSSRAPPFPAIPVARADCRLMRCADVSNPLTDDITNNVLALCVT